MSAWPIRERSTKLVRYAPEICKLHDSDTGVAHSIIYTAVRASPEQQPETFTNGPNGSCLYARETSGLDYGLDKDETNFCFVHVRGRCCRE